MATPQQVKMARRSEPPPPPPPPRFGEWEGGGDQYTEYFEKASKGRNNCGRKKPNDLKEINSDSPLTEDPKVNYGIAGPATPKHPHDNNTLNSRLEGNDGVGRKAVDSPHHHHHHRQGGVSSNIDGTKRATRTNTASDRSIEQSPLHHHQSRAIRGGGVSSSPSWERRGGSAESSGHGVVPPVTPGRSRLKSSVARGDEALADDDGPTVPKFGAWDESDPASGEGYTQLFDRVRDEKTNAGKVPLTPNGQKRRAGNETSKGCFCFPWGRK